MLLLLLVTERWEVDSAGEAGRGNTEEEEGCSLSVVEEEVGGGSDCKGDVLSTAGFSGRLCVVVVVVVVVAT